jgi:cytochrome oxidase assembly protein ShyY1
VASRFWRVAVRPRWVAALLLCLGIAAGFAGLGQWQLSRSVETAAPADAPDTEVAVPLASIAEPQTEVTQPQLGRRVTVSGEFVPGDSLVVTDRNNGGAEQGVVVVGHFVTDDGVTLVVALGWMPGSEEETPGDAYPGDLEGRYLPSEAPTDSDFQAGERSAISVAELINRWPDASPAYGGYLVLDDPPSGLGQIYSPEPSREIGFNLLNLFYALEWAVFAGFAIYLWYRLVRDVVEREHEESTVE